MFQKHLEASPPASPARVPCAPKSLVDRSMRVDPAAQSPTAPRESRCGSCIAFPRSHPSLFPREDPVQSWLLCPSSSWAPGRLLLQTSCANSTPPLAIILGTSEEPHLHVDKYYPSDEAATAPRPPRVTGDSSCLAFGAATLFFPALGMELALRSPVSPPCPWQALGLDLHNRGSQFFVINKKTNDIHVERTYIQKVYIYSKRIYIVRINS